MYRACSNTVIMFDDIRGHVMCFSTCAWSAGAPTAVAIGDMVKGFLTLILRAGSAGHSLESIPKWPKFCGCLLPGTADENLAKCCEWWLWWWQSFKSGSWQWSIRYTRSLGSTILAHWESTRSVRYQHWIKMKDKPCISKDYIIWRVSKI